jgi:hypothetical protein
LIPSQRLRATFGPFFPVDKITCTMDNLLVYLSIVSHQPNNTVKQALTAFRKHGGILRTKDALRAGIHPRTLYALRDDGRVERLSRGLYRITTARPLGNPDLVAVAMRAADAVVCLISPGSAPAGVSSRNGRRGEIRGDGQAGDAE